MDELREVVIHPDPFEQFRLWFDDAVAAGAPEANAMTLATATADGRPSARMVLLKGFDQHGFVFYTNYESRKGRELHSNPWAALVFFWHTPHRQIRIEGPITRVAPEESDAYFATRARGSQIAARASRQSRAIPGREALENRVRELEEEYGEGNVPRPEYWGGYRLQPVAFEFWQGRPNRLHDRIRFGRLDDGAWILERLAP